MKLQSVRQLLDQRDNSTKSSNSVHRKNVAKSSREDSVTLIKKESSEQKINELSSRKKSPDTMRVLSIEELYERGYGSERTKKQSLSQMLMLQKKDFISPNICKEDRTLMIDLKHFKTSDKTN